MNRSAVTTPNDPIVVGNLIVKRSESLLPFSEMHPLAQFSTYKIAELAIRLVRRNPDWLKAAELMMDDEDFLTVQVLYCRLKKLNGSMSSAGQPSRDHRPSDPEKRVFTRTWPNVQDVTLGDLL